LHNIALSQCKMLNSFEFPKAISIKTNPKCNKSHPKSETFFPKK
jgi:hypothetical protein